MKKIKIDIEVSNDFAVKGSIWEPETKKAILVICHGMAEHIERYHDFASFLANNGYVVIGYDQRGHGQTASTIDNIGYMSDTNNINILVADLFEVIEFSKKKYNLPIFLLGHSMGSFISLNYIQHYGNEINGVILSGSTINQGLVLNLGILLSKLIMKIKGRKHKSKFIHNLVIKPYNNVFKPNRTSSDWLSRDENIVDAYVNDEYCGGTFSVSFYHDLFTNFKSIYRRLSFIPGELPIYLFSGALDPVGGLGKNITKLYNLLKKHNIKDFEFKLYKDGRHEMLNEINKEEVYDDVLIWLDKHI